MNEETIQQTIQTHRSIIAPSEDLLCVDISRINLRQARKIAKTLGIKQKVNGKDQPKTWLIKQIEQKLKEQPENSAIVNEIFAA